LWAGAATAVPPVVRNLDRLGVQIGATTVLTIDGDNLLPEPRIVLPAPIVKQVLRPKGTANRIAIEITLDRAALPGLYNLRLANSHGVSAARVVAVDHLPQRGWEPKLSELPTALHGTLAGSGKLTTAFAGKAGQTVLCEIEAQRLGSKVRPVLHLSNESGRRLAWAMPGTAPGGDARLSTTLPADGLYTVEVHDMQYAAGTPGNVRLKLGSWQYADAVFPPAVRRGQTATVELLGNPAGRRVPVQAGGDAAAVPAPWADPAAASGMRPRVLLSDLPEVVENNGATVPEVTALPVALNGRIAKPGETDRYRLAVRPGTRLRFEVFADRLGSPMDAVLKLERDNGTLLVQADDAPGSPDPVLDFTVPVDVKTLVVAIEDLHGRGGSNLVYRVLVRSAEPVSAIKDFRLFVPGGELNVPAGGSRVVEIDVERDGYAGPLRLSLDGSPAGVQVQGVDVPAGANGALLVLTGSGTSPSSALASLRGTNLDPKEKIVRTARDRNHSLRTLQPWLAEELAVALTPRETVAFTAEWGALPSDVPLVPGSTLKVPVKFIPPKEEHGGARFYLLSSHRPPRVNGQPDVNQMLRKDQGLFLDLPAGKTEGEFVVLVPATLPGVPQDLAYRADLLSKDRTRVIAQAFTPVRRFAVLNPLAVQLTTTQFQIPLDAKIGAEVKLTGKVQRRGGFKGDVTVSLTGVPPGVAVPTAAVAADKTDFQLALRFPASFRASELNTLEVFATGRFGSQSPLLNRSEPVAVRVKLMPPASPAKK
jgi:hypothetical protein